MAGAVRFTTAELIETESRIVTAAERALGLEQEVFAELARPSPPTSSSSASWPRALAELDCEAGLAAAGGRAGLRASHARRQQRRSRSAAGAIPWWSRR